MRLSVCHLSNMTYLSNIWPFNRTKILRIAQKSTYEYIIRLFKLIQIKYSLILFKKTWIYWNIHWNIYRSIRAAFSQTHRPCKKYNRQVLWRVGLTDQGGSAQSGQRHDSSSRARIERLRMTPRVDEKPWRNTKERDLHRALRKYKLLLQSAFVAQTILFVYARQE